MVIIAIIGIGLLIFVHEFGHFIAAKLMKIEVNEFMLGLPGPKLFKFKRKETTYGVTALLLGGYVKFADSKGSKNSKHLFELQPIWKKITVILAGPLMNFILPIFLATTVFLIGVPCPTNTIKHTLQGFPAEKVGFQSGDKIVEINGAKVSEWSEIIKIIRANPNKEVEFVVLRNDKRVALKTTLAEKDSIGFLGVETKLETRSLGLVGSIKEGVTWTFAVFKEMLKLFYKLITQQLDTFFKEARSPIGIVSEATQVARESFLDFLMFLSIISLNLTIVNLIPIPPLDGGIVLIFLAEKIRKKPVDASKLATIQAVGMTLLLILMLYVIFSDIMRLLPQVSPGW